ncbi:hypothetical protein E9232_000277 [Inquilinus ginsengisoli]|uniref:Glycerophosphoryl diester phosphodiesterase membrane domain-containing protein n=1 Tax=Inquilinus ginsengisoli TaxID=363840 RepID=A0ABU1JGM9_9PROT|nr:hypothetical protein [Inquilinus ginsengisoli]MDR6287778.1 hypothetical protein [Inquilinus ginsengisoli]
MVAAFSSGDLLRRAFGWSLGHPGALARVAAPAIVFAAILRLAIGQLWGDEIVAMMATGEPSGPAMLAGLLYGVVLLLAVALIAVSWHRYVLRGEIVPFPADAATLRFALYQIWLGALGIATVMVALIILSLVFGAVGGPSVMQSFAAGGGLAGGLWSALATTVLVTAVMTVPFAFYGLVLPATAIGDRGLVAGESRRLLRGHRIAGLVALIATSVLSLVISLAVGYALDAILPEGDGFGVAEIVGELVALALVAFETSLVAGVLSELYRDLRLPELARGTAPD